MASRSIARLVMSLATCLGVGVLESLVTRPEIATWYASLAKPSWTPPPFAFPIVWTLLYILMGISFWRLWDPQPPAAARSKAMTWFLVQLALNALWSPVFFGWHGTRTALIIIVALLVALAATIITAARVDRAAAWLLAPYLIGSLRDYGQRRRRGHELRVELRQVSGRSQSNEANDPDLRLLTREWSNLIFEFNDRRTLQHEFA